MVWCSPLSDEFRLGHSVDRDGGKVFILSGGRMGQPGVGSSRDAWVSSVGLFDLLSACFIFLEMCIVGAFEVCDVYW